MKAEQMIIDKIILAFPSRACLSDERIENNPYVFEKLSAREAAAYIPAYMIYVLQKLRCSPGSMVYMQLLFAINTYSKCKASDDLSAGLWFVLDLNQRRAMLAFLSHLVHNQPGNIDASELKKIISRWQES
ncbi:hypothetical protein [Pseudomonas sp.]|uniref:hypothetical protein n=1 Tax=Pseudomonas sp. TaxID=306 RepID=UPI003D0FAA39